MKLTKEELILSIARCEEIETATTNEQHPCYDMVNVQTTKEFIKNFKNFVKFMQGVKLELYLLLSIN